MATTSRFTTALSLGAALNFLVCSVESRYFIKSERVLAADYLIFIGLEDFSDETAEIVVLCVQTSGLPTSCIILFKDEEPFNQARG